MYNEHQDKPLNLLKFSFFLFICPTIPVKNILVCKNIMTKKYGVVSSYF